MHSFRIKDKREGWLSRFPFINRQLNGTRSRRLTESGSPPDPTSCVAQEETAGRDKDGGSKKRPNVNSQ
jgi:hypothetical protein